MDSFEVVYATVWRPKMSVFGWFRLQCDVDITCVYIYIYIYIYIFIIMHLLYYTEK